MRPNPSPPEGEGDQRARLPLEGIRVLDSTYVFALPYAGGLLADMGAEVIKVEGPGRPDVTRTGGYSGVFAENDLGEDWWNRPSTYNLIHRGKQSITLDMTDERGRDLFKRAGDGLRRGDGELHPAGDAQLGAGLPQHAQAAARRHTGVEHRLRPRGRAVLGLPGAGHDAGGDPRALLDHRLPPGEGPAKAGASFVDFLSTWTALFAIGAALRYRARTGLGQWVDMGMYQSGVMFLSEYILDAIANGREGGAHRQPTPVARAPGLLPGGGRRPVDHAVGGRRRPVALALCRVMGQPELASDAAVLDSLAGTAGEPRRAGRDHRGVDLGPGPLRHDARAAGGGHPVRAGADGGGTFITTRTSRAATSWSGCSTRRSAGWASGCS